MSPTRLASTTLLLLTLGAGPAAPLVAQSVVRVSAEQENFRVEPRGTKLATVMGGAELRVLSEQEQWREVRLEGWIWAPSVEPADRMGLDLVVSADGGENIRARPDGEIVARALRGMLLAEAERSGNWVRVYRDGWLWAPSVERVAGGERAGGQAAEAGGGPGAESSSSAEHRSVGTEAARLHLTPEGDTAAILRPGAGLEVVGREGEWTRVRLTGWVRSSSLVTPDSAAAASRLTARDLRENPDRYRGRRVRWTVHFVALRRAEAIRTDFYEGEPFILARPPEESGGFVYLAVPPELLSRVQELQPLQPLEVLARVRTGRSSLMGVPILDLLAIY